MRRSVPRRRARNRLIECLEPRVLLAFNPAGVEFRANTETNNQQSNVAIASDADGDFVAAWHTIGQDGGGFGVYAKRHNSAGAAQGDEFLVNTTVMLNQQDPAVAMDADGDFVIAYSNGTFTGEAINISFQRFNAAGVAQGNETTANTFPTGHQLRPAVAMDADGDFVVVWQSQNQDGGGYGIYAQRFNSAGLPQGIEFKVNTVTANNQQYPSVAMDASGDFVIAWQSYAEDGAHYGIYAQRYNAAGIVQGINFKANTTTPENQSEPSVAMDFSGNFVIAWQSFPDAFGEGTYFQRYQATGAPQGIETRANTHTYLTQGAASVALDANGDFIIAWHSYGQDGSSYGIYAQRYSSAGATQGSEFKVNSATANRQMAPAVAIDAEGDVVVAWQSYLQDGSQYGVYAQRYDETVDTAGPFVTDLFANGKRIAPGGATDLPIASLVLGFSENLNVAGGAAGANSATNPTNYILRRNGVDVSAEILSVAFALNVAAQRYEATLTFAAALGPATYELRAKSNLRDVAGMVLDGNQDGFNGDQFSRTFSVAVPQPQGGEIPVNFTPSNHQSEPAVAIDADGDFVVVWQSLNQDGSSYGVYGQRYNAAGAKLGPEIRANTTTNLAQRDPAVAMDEDGDFVVTWTSDGQDGSLFAVYAQRFSAAGVPQGIEFRVNVVTNGQQVGPSVAMMANGNFVIAWQTNDADSTGIAARLYGADGTALSGEVPVNATTADSQFAPAVAMNDTGAFVVTWHSYGADGRADIKAQRFSPVAAPVGGEMTINVFPTDNQAYPSVAMDDDGAFIIAWTDYFGQDGLAGSLGIYARRYNAAGEAQTGEFLVNTHTNLDQASSTVFMDADGDFVIAWESYQDGSREGIYAQRYNSAGAKLGLEFRVNTTTAGVQLNPSIALDADGDFVVAWQSQPVGGTNDILAQRFASIASPLTTVPASGFEIPVNTTTADSQSAPAIARDADGEFVVVWQSNLQDGSGQGIYARRYSAAGNPLSGEFPVNTFTAGSQFVPAVEIDADGDFVVAWVSRDQDGAGDEVYARRFGANGAPQGEEFRVNTTIANSQSTPDLAMDSDGNFVIAWSGGIPFTDRDIYARRFSAEGVALGNEFRVNTSFANDQNGASVAVDADGDFVIAWHSYGGEDGSGAGVYARRYNVVGAPQGGDFPVNTTTAGNQRSPTVAMDYSGDFVIAWEGIDPDATYGIYAQRYNAAGVRQGDEFPVNSSDQGSQTFPAAAMDPDGDFVITWNDNFQDGGNLGVYGQRFAANGARIGNQFRAPTPLPPSQSIPSIGMDSDGDFVIAWNSDGQDGSSQGIFAQRFDLAFDNAGPVVAEVTSGGERVAPGESLVQNISSLDFTFSEDLILTGGEIGPNSAWNKANYSLYRNGFPFDVITFGDFVYDSAARKHEGKVLFNAPLPNGNYHLTISDRLRDYAGHALDGNADDTPGGDFMLAFTIDVTVPIDPEFKVNTTTAGLQDSSSVSLDAAGNFVVVWMGQTPGAGTDIYAQRFNAAGAPQGSEFVVHAPNVQDQYVPDVAMDPDGDFVVTWTSNIQDGSSTGVYARRFNAAGVAQGNEFKVNTFTIGSQQTSTVATDAAGNFIIVWESYQQVSVNDGADIFAQRYAVDGSMRGAEFRVNVSTPGGQRDPDVAANADGAFVVTWASQIGDGSGYGIYARQYSPASVAKTGDLPVNTAVANSQFNPAIAMDAEGDFVIAWMSTDQDASGEGVYAQLYNAAAARVGSEFRANTFVTGNQHTPEAAMDADGDFVITWESAGQDGSSTGVYAQRYNALGAAFGVEFHANTTTQLAQGQPAIAMDPGGDFVITWGSQNQDGSSFGIYAQRYAPNQAPTTSGIAPVNVFENAPDGAINLWSAFADSTDADSAMTYTITGNTNALLFTQTQVNPLNGTLTLDYAPAQLGQSTITVRATDTSGVFVETSFLVSVLERLRVTAGQFIFNTAPHRYRVTFNRDIAPATLQPGDMQLERVPGVFSTATGVSYDAPSRTATFSFLPVPLPDGNYRASLAVNAVSDTLGIPLSEAYSGDFFVLSGDFNRNRQVEFSDLITAAANFGRSPATYAEGDADLSGSVAFTDLIMVAAKFGTILFPPTSPASPAPAAAVGSTKLFSQTPIGAAARPKKPLKRVSRV